MMFVLEKDFDPQKFLNDLDAEKNIDKRLQAIVEISVASLAILSDRASVIKYAVADAMICHLSMMIAVELKKELALSSLRCATDLVKCYDPGTKH
jgi:hypothetical protein